MFEDDSSNTPADIIIEIAKGVVLDLLPYKSREVFEFAYNRFMRWCNEKNIKSYSETVLLVYFSNLSSTMKTSTLWSQYSMVKATLNLKNNVDIGKFSNLRAFLKKQNNGYTLHA